MERPRDIRAKCQAGKERDPGWYVVHRRYSIYITWACLRLGIPLAAVSLAMMGSGVLGALLAASPSPWANAFGFLALYASFLLDKVDGEIARFREVQSVRGILLDRFHHRLVEPALFLAVAYHELASGGSIPLLVAGFAAAILGNFVDENQHLSPYILLKYLRETNRPPLIAAATPAELRLSGAARVFRPLKMFRTFIVAVPAFALCYVVKAATGRPAPAYYLYASASGLAVYAAFQCVYYYRVQLHAEIRAIVGRFPGLITQRPGVTMESADAGRGGTAQDVPGTLRPGPARTDVRGASMLSACLQGPREGVRE